MAEDYRRSAVMPIIEVVAKYYHVDPIAILGMERTSTVVLARTMCMYLAQKHLRYSLTELGVAFARDHTTVLQAVRRLTNRLSTDAVLRDATERLTSLTACSAPNVTGVYVNIPDQAVEPLLKMVGTGLLGSTTEEVLQRLAMMKLYELTYGTKEKV